MRRLPLLTLIAALALPQAVLAQMQVVSHVPALNVDAATTDDVVVTFDQPVNVATVNDTTFRAWGMWSGPARGTFSFSNGDATVTLNPDDPFSAGEFVFVNISHDLMSATAMPLRSEGYAFQFVTQTTASSATFAEIDRFDNMTGPPTRIYGASAADLNNDEYLDLTTINEDTDDVRVFLNLADGSGLYGPMLAPQGIGHEASPNAPADFDNDGDMDLCVAAADSDNVWILLGAGDGTFSSITGISVLPTGNAPHGIQPIDVDGDADLDVVFANVDSGNLGLLVNNGAGVFSGPTFFDGGVSGEYGLAAADMDGDGITDLVVGGRNGGEVATMLGNGNGTFTAAGAAQSAGGSTWVVVLGDLNNDGDLDVASANNGDANVGILLGQGDGTFDPVTTVAVGGHTPSVDLGDLDGDGDPDMVASSFGGGFWKWYSNDGTGAFTVVDSFPALMNPSCSVLLDFDNDGDLDLVLTDEIANTLFLMENGGQSSCSPVPQACRLPTEGMKSKLVLRDRDPDDDRDVLVWTWRKGQATIKADFGDPTSSTDDYALCIYEDDVLLEGFDIPGGELCNGQNCWKEPTKGYRYRDPERTPDGIMVARLIEGGEGMAKMRVRGKGSRLGVQGLGGITGVLEVQMQRTNDLHCWGATYSPPFSAQDSTMLKAFSDDPPTTLPPLPFWSDLHTQVIDGTCGSCHGPSASGGLSGLDDCNTGHANLVNMASVELPSMDRVEPTDPTSSWLMHKLDNTQGTFTAMCTGMFCGGLMPLGGPQLDIEVRDAVRTWITNGAVNDCP